MRTIIIILLFATNTNFAATNPTQNLMRTQPSNAVSPHISNIAVIECLYLTRNKSIDTILAQSSGEARDTIIYVRVNKKKTMREIIESFNDWRWITLGIILLIITILSIIETFFKKKTY